MKNIKLLLLLAVVSLTTVSCSTKKENSKEGETSKPKMLVLFSVLRLYP